MTASQVLSMLDKSTAYLDLSRLQSIEDARIIADYLDEGGFKPRNGSSMFKYIETRFVTVRDYHCLVCDKPNTQTITDNQCGFSFATRITAASFIMMIERESRKRISVEDFDLVLS